MRELRDYQSAAIDMVWQAMAEGRRRPMLMMATGAGKTRTAAEIINRALSKGKRVVMTAPAIELIDQTVEALYSEGIAEVGVIQAQHRLTDYSKPVQVASVDTLQRRTLPQADLVIVDEAHRGAKVIFQWMQQQPRLPFIGLSATPWARGLAKHYDELIIAATTQQLIKRGYLSPFRVFAPSHPDLTGVKTLAGDYHERQLAEAMDKPKLTADVVSTWIKLGEDRPTLCFAVNRAHARSLLRDFERAGVAAGYVDGDTERTDRDAVRQAFERGEIKVVVNVGVLTTGVDWDVRCIILARPTKSEMLYVQIIGRGLRLAEGKADCLILDHSDTTLKLGFVTDIHHTSLDDGAPKKPNASERKERPVPVPRECPACTRLKPAGVYACPSCGFEPKKVEDVETRRGELLQLGGKQVKASFDDKRSFYAQLLWVAKDRHKSSSWVTANYKERFGVWPRGMDHVTPEIATRATLGWIKSRQIAWVKGQQKAEKQEARHAS